MLQDSEDEQGVLGGEDSQEQGARQGGAEETGGNGLALHYGMGVRAEAIETGRDARIDSVYPEPYLVVGSWGEDGFISTIGGRE